MSSPFDKLLDTIEWEEVPGTYVGNLMPFVTNSGKLSVGDINITVHQLSNGQRVIDEKDIAKFFKG